MNRWGRYLSAYSGKGRPTTVRWAIFLALVAIAIGAANSFRAIFAYPFGVFFWDHSDTARLAALVVTTIIIGFELFVISSFARQRNWARFVFLILALMKITVAVYLIAQVQGVTVAMLFVVAAYPLRLTAAVLLMVPQSARS